MSLRGKAAIVGIGEVPTRRIHPDRSLMGLCAEATALALKDVGLKKEDIDGLVTDGVAAPPQTAEYIGIKPQFATGVTMQGASGATATMVAAAAINAGLCNTALVVMGNSREEENVREESPEEEWRGLAYDQNGKSLMAWRPEPIPAMD